MTISKNSNHIPASTPLLERILIRLGQLEGKRLCRFCYELKPEEEFFFNKKRSWSKCAECFSGRKCQECGRRLSPDNFSQDNSKLCIECKSTVKDRKSIVNAKYRAAHKERIQAQTVEWQRTHAERCREQRRDSHKRKRAEMKQAVLAHYGAFCSCCGETEITFLTLDHTNNNGAYERQVHGKTDTWKHAFYDGFPVTLRVLCHNCNSGRHRNGGLCPHEIARQQSQGEAS